VAVGRLALGPELERGPALQVSVDGRPVTAYAGETVAGILFAEGLAATRRTRRGSPRGVFCGMGACFDCLVVVDGVPNTRACVTFAVDGMSIERQEGFGPARAFDDRGPGAQ
jgi:aerobic-type carbon monoxide dehydrogenase small subunit (CoxS/CutS family)